MDSSSSDDDLVVAAVAQIAQLVGLEEDEEEEADDEQLAWLAIAARIIEMHDATGPHVRDAVLEILSVKQYCGSARGRRFIDRGSDDGGWIRNYLGPLVPRNGAPGIDPNPDAATALERHNFKGDFGVSWAVYLELVEELRKPKYDLKPDAKSCTGRFVPFCVKVLAWLWHGRRAPTSKRDAKMMASAGLSTIDKVYREASHESNAPPWSACPVCVSHIMLCGHLSMTLGICCFPPAVL